MATLLGIAIRKASRAPMETLEEAEISLESGIAEDFRGGVENRQVTVLVKEAWEAACTAQGEELSWTTRRANLLVDELDLKESTGSLLKIGGALLEITGETLPCPRMDEQRPGLQDGPWTGLACRCHVQSGRGGGRSGSAMRWPWKIP